MNPTAPALVQGQDRPQVINYSFHLTELNPRQISDNRLEPYSPLLPVMANHAPCLLDRHKAYTDQIKPEAHYRVEPLWHPVESNNYALREKSTDTLIAITRQLSPLENIYVLGVQAPALLEFMLGQANQMASRAGMIGVAHIEVRSSPITITQADLERIEASTGKLSSFEVYQLTEGKHIRRDDVDYNLDPERKLYKRNVSEKQPLTPQFIVDLIKQEYNAIISHHNAGRMLQGDYSPLLTRESGVPGKAKLSFAKDGVPTTKFDESQPVLFIPKTMRGYAFTRHDREKLLVKGQLGKLVQLQGEKTAYPAYIGVDTELNRIIVLRADKVVLPSTIKGVTLTSLQAKHLKEGKTIRVNELSGAQGLFNAEVSINAAKGKLDFRITKFIKEATKEQLGPRREKTAITADSAKEKPERINYRKKPRMS